MTCDLPTVRPDHRLSAATVCHLPGYATPSGVIPPGKLAEPTHREWRASDRGATRGGPGSNTRRLPENDSLSLASFIRGNSGADFFRGNNALSLQYGIELVRDQTFQYFGFAGGPANFHG